MKKSIKTQSIEKVCRSPQSSRVDSTQFDESKLGRNTLRRFGDTQTASKYNGGTLDIKDRKYLVGIDYLILNLNGKMPIEMDEEDYKKDSIRFINIGKATKHFQTMFNLYYKDELLGQIQAYPREGNKLGEDTIQLKFENQNFYRDIDLRKVSEEFLTAFGIKFNNITRLDIYLDSYGFDNGLTLNDLDYLLDKGTIITDTRVKEKNKYSSKVDNRFFTTGFSWGSRGSGKYLRIYNKTKELKSGNKDWITAHHQVNGLTKKDVIRFEYELKNDFLKHIQNFNWLDVFEPAGQFELLDLARKGHFSFVYEDGQLRNDRKERVELIDWKIIREMPEFVYDYNYQRRKPMGYSKRSYQVLVGSLLKEYVMMAQPESIAIQINELLDRHSLREWFEKKVYDYIDKFCKLRYYHYDFNESKLEEHFNLLGDEEPEMAQG